MSSNHIDKVAISLYAAGYRYLPKETVRLIGEHLSGCETCRRQLLLALNSYAAEQNRMRRVVESARDVYLGTSSTANSGVKELLSRFLDLPVGVGANMSSASGHLERLVRELDALEDVRDIGFCIRAIFAASESLGWEVWFLLGPKSLADRLALETDVESVCFFIRQVYQVNREAGRELLGSMDFKRLIDKATEFRKSEDLLQCLSRIIEAEEGSEKSLVGVLTDRIADRVQSEVDQINRILYER